MEDYFRTTDSLRVHNLTLPVLNLNPESVPNWGTRPNTDPVFRIESTCPKPKSSGLLQPDTETIKPEP